MFQEIIVKQKFPLESCLIVEARGAILLSMPERNWGVPAVKSAKPLIKTFGQEHKQLQTSEVVELSVRGLDKNESISVTTYTIPLVCTHLQDESIEVTQQMYEHLLDLDFADDSSVQCGSQVDLLIGNDFYWMFFTGGIKWGESGPVAMELKLGWILSGVMKICLLSLQMLCLAILYVSIHNWKLIL